MESPTIPTPEKKPETASEFCERIKSVFKIPGQNVQVQISGIYAEGNMYERDSSVHTIEVIETASGSEVRVSITGPMGNGEFYVSKGFNMGKPIFYLESRPEQSDEESGKKIDFNFSKVG